MEELQTSKKNENMVLTRRRKLVNRAKKGGREMVNGTKKGGRQLVNTANVEHPKNYGRFFFRILPSIIIWNLCAFALYSIFKEFIPTTQIAIIQELASGPWEVFFSIFGIVYAVVVGMQIVESIRRYNSLHALVGQELNAIKDVRDYLIYLKKGDKAIPAIRKSLHKYVKSVIENDWREMISMSRENSFGSSGSDTSHELVQLMKDVRLINTRQETGKIALGLIMNKVSEITTYRTDRYMNSVDRIKYPMHILLSGLSGAIIVILVLMFIEPWWLHFLLFGVTAAGMATLFELILHLDHLAVLNS